MATKPISTTFIGIACLLFGWWQAQCTSVFQMQREPIPEQKMPSPNLKRLLGKPNAAGIKSTSKRAKNKNRHDGFDFVSLEQRNLLASVVYNDGLQPPFENWSWSTTVDFDNNAPVQNGQSSMAVTHTGGWAGLYIGSGVAVPVGAQEEIGFSIHGGNGGQTLKVYYADINNNYDFVELDVITPVAGQWTDVVIDFEQFSQPATIGGIVVQEFTGEASETYYIDDWVIEDLIPEETGNSGDGPVITIDSGTVIREISEDIYGLNFADPVLAADIGLPVDRWGGNSTTRFNWEIDATNLASDWYFENYPGETPDPSTLPNGSTSDLFVQKDQSVGADTIFTVNTIGWAAKSRTIEGGFKVDKYGAQQDVDPYHPNNGNGILLDGTPITGNDPFDTSIQVDETFTQNWIQHLQSNFGNAANGGVKYYALDNEPMLWDSTHRDVHPEPASYDEVLTKGLNVAAAIKAVDPSAQVLGPTVWGWTAYFYSAMDAAAGGDWWNNPLDQNAHGGQDFLPWYLSEMAQAEADTGTRLLDYLDIHFYPQASGVALGSAGDAATQEIRTRSTRALWDPTYVDESWINEEVQLIPRMRSWIDAHYPGTKLAITEYNWGGIEHINGAVTQADVLGIFGREGVDLATMWGPPDADDPAGYAFRMFRNYDGQGTEGSRFGNISLSAQTEDVDQVSVFAARRDSDNTMTVLLVNKSTESLITPVNLTEIGNAEAEVYRYDTTNLNQIVQDTDLTFTSGTAELTLPGYSITLLEIPIQEVDLAIVTNTNATGAGSLRAAIEYANATSGQQTISFAIGSSGTQTIQLSTPLPALTDSVIIDGRTQNGFADVPIIVIDGSAITEEADGFFVAADNTEIRGLAIVGFEGDGIELSAASNATISQSYIGVNVDGAAAGNDGHGIRVRQSPNATIVDNVIGSNGEHGVYFVGGQSQFGVVADNMIGTNADGNLDRGNTRHGVMIDLRTRDNEIRGNTIAHNQIGVRSVTGGVNNFITENSIFDNAFSGIDWGLAGRNRNDAGDFDVGPNLTQNSPVLNSAVLQNDSLMVSLNVDSALTAVTYPLRIEFFKDDGTGQGEQYLGTATFTEQDFNNGAMMATIDVANVGLIVGGDRIVATASDAAENTSEFSLAKSISGQGFRSDDMGGMKKGRTEDGNVEDEQLPPKVDLPRSGKENLTLGLSGCYESNRSLLASNDRPNQFDQAFEANTQFEIEIEDDLLKLM